MRLSSDFIYLGVALAVIMGAIVYLESDKSPRTNPDSPSLVQDMQGKDKAVLYKPAREIVNPSGYINTSPVKLADLIGKQVILIDFWTYSCINCQRTLPHLNAWHEKYKDKGLTIVSIHTPEFAFEHELANVQAAVNKYGIKYPVVLDNEYATWQAYGNQYWPRKYLIDIDGYVVYDHIGEGAYEETESKILEALRERSVRLQQAVQLQPQDAPSIVPANLTVRSPETYFGALRNKLLSSGEAGKVGIQMLFAPSAIELNRLYLTGSWDIQPEFAMDVDASARVLYRFQGKKVHMVASGLEGSQVKVLLDGKVVDRGSAGEDVDSQGLVDVNADGLYRLISLPESREHTLELQMVTPGVKLFTFTFE